ncbi:MAG: hypothetical protein F6J95_007660 [Leptolyngbya sp. SIO1E4]|nr:hypothetical protein [Leptolyngbya sp. SIO1E4]
MNQTIRLASAAGLGLASVLISMTSPSLTNLTAEDMARFSNGERVEVTAYRPNRLLSGGLGVIGLGMLGWWLYREMTDGDGTAPVVIPTQAEPTQGQVIKAPAGVPAPKRYVDVSAVLANQMRPTLITGNPRIGKGIVVANGIRQVKSRLDCPVWLIQPKYHPKEHAYWEPCDRIKGFMLEGHIGDAEYLEQLGKELSEFIFEWRKQAARPTLLVIDELSMLKSVMPKWYKDCFIPQLKVEMSSGETDDRALWAVTQSSLAGDIDISRGERSTFDLLAIENPDSNEHMESLCASYQGVPKIEDDLIYQQSLSPKQAVFYHSVYGEWLPMLAYKVPQGAEGAEGAGRRSGRSGRNQSVSDSANLLTTPSTPSVLPDWLDLPTLLSVSKAIDSGVSDYKIIEDILGLKGRKFEEGKERLTNIKAIIEENS